MRRVIAQTLWVAFLFASTMLVNAESVAPKIDKPKIEAYLRYAEGITPNVKIEVDDPVASSFPGFFRLDVRLLLGSQKENKRYYLSEDGRRLVNGTLWSLDESPFTDTLTHLTADGPSFGLPDAKVTIIVFSDFQCPFCRQLEKNLRTNIPQKYPKDVRVVLKSFPIDAIHPWARAAAEAGVCMADQSTGAFWAYHDWMFDHQTTVNAQFQDKKSDFSAYLKDTAAALAEGQKVDPAKVRACIDTHASAAEVNRDVAEGQKLQIASTPTFYVNGRPIGGAIPWASIDTLIQMELNRPKEIAAPTAQTGSSSAMAATK